MSKTWRGQESVIEIEDTNGNQVPVGILDDPAVTAPEQDVQELRGAGSTEFQDLQKTETAPTSSGTVSEFAIDAWDDLVDYDEAAGKLDDSADVKQFDVTTIFEAADGSTKEIILKDAYVDGGIELGGSREDFIGLDLTFIGRTIEIINTDASA